MKLSRLKMVILWDKLKKMLLLRRLSGLLLPNLMIILWIFSVKLKIKRRTNIHRPRILSRLISTLFRITTGSTANPKILSRFDNDTQITFNDLKNSVASKKKPDSKISYVAGNIQQLFN